MDCLDEEMFPLLHNAENCEGEFHGFKTKRAGGLLGKSDVCQGMALNPTVLGVMDHFLLPNCSQYQINLTQLISIGPGERQQILHPDDPLFPFEHPNYQSMLNVMWAVNDFTAENGATHIAPGSHRWERDRRPEPHEVVQAEMKAGSYLIYLGSAIHGGGANRSASPRTGIVMSYCLGWLRQAEPQHFAVPMEKAKTFPEPLQRLMGYFVHKPNLGAVDGRDPIELLNGAPQPGRVQFKDYMPEDAKRLLKEHYENNGDVAWSDRQKKAS
jgi:ectoine hydroxylase-related dioxygenase (phytanoyl-CoA dioxygenase family)